MPTTHHACALRNGTWEQQPLPVEDSTAERLELPNGCYDSLPAGPLNDPIARYFLVRAANELATGYHAGRTSRPSPTAEGEGGVRLD